MVPKSPLGTRESKRLRELSTTHTTDPGEIRRRVTETLNELAEADATVVYGLTHDGVHPRVTWWELSGDRRHNVGMEMLSRDPELWPVQSRESFVNPPRIQRTSFVLIDQLMPRALAEQTPIFTRVYKAAGIVDQTRLLVIHGDRFISSVAVTRSAGRFTAREARRLRPAVEVVAAALTGADTLERAQLGTAAYIVGDAEGSVVHCSASAEPWLGRPGFRDGLRAAIRAFDRGTTAEWCGVLHSAEVRLVRLDGAPVHYLACVTLIHPLVLGPIGRLPPMQRRIARLAATGLTIREMATELGRSENTIKTQLKLIYERLGVASRVELAAALAREPHENG